MKKNRKSTWTSMMMNDLIHGQDPDDLAFKTLLKIIKENIKNKLSELAHSKK